MSAKRSPNIGVFATEIKSKIQMHAEDERITNKPSKIMFRIQVDSIRRPHERQCKLINLVIHAGSQATDPI